MDNMRRNAMNERYGHSHMMQNTSMSCDTCGNARVIDHCDDNCDRNRNRDQLYGMPLGMGYVPWQNFECTYEPAQAFQAGTIFPELDKPFYGRRGMRS